MISRRNLVTGGLAVGAALAAGKSRIVKTELLPVRATARTVWLFVRLTDQQGRQGLGEASDAFGFGATTKADALRMESELQALSGLLPDATPGRFIARARARAAAGGQVTATAYSAIEQALWDLAGQQQAVPIASLLGKRVHTRLPLYANINRATSPRTPAGFADAARRAYAEGFRAFKLAPFDGFPPPGSPSAAIEGAVEAGIASVFAVRQAVGRQARVMVDCHSVFDVERARDVAQRLEPAALTWYEEPVAPTRVAETKQIRGLIKQPMAGGEMLFGVEGFAPLCDAVHVIMPDVKHCGGLAEFVRIARMAGEHRVEVSPHNPAGPVSTVATLHAACVCPNVKLVEIQWGEVPWRPDLVTPAEPIAQGEITLSDRPGLGLRLNEDLVRRYAL